MFIGLSLIFGMIRAGEAKTPRDIRIGGEFCRRRCGGLAATGLARAWRADHLNGCLDFGLGIL